MAKTGVTVKILGQQELESALNQLGARAEAVLEEAVLAGAEVIRDEASNRAPRRTGRLAKNIVAEVVEKSATGVAVKVGPSKEVFYGRFVEFGTSKMRSQPFLYPTLEAKKAEAQAAIREIIRRALIK